MKNFLLLCFMLCFTYISIGQVTVNNNFPTSPGIDYVGWGAASNLQLDIANEATQPIFLYTSSGTGSAFNNMRMRIFEDNLQPLSTTTGPINVGRVGIMESGLRWNLNPLPASLLHLGHGWPVGAGGHRAWMDVGTFTMAGSDNMYVGLKHQSADDSRVLWDDRMDAIINWGDNETAHDNLNDLRFIFTTPQGSSGDDQASAEGLEVMRMAFNGYVGVGSFRHPTNMLAPVRPARRFEIVDRGDDDGRSLPQLRLTFEPDNDAFGGTDARWTDFETTDLGHLYIHPNRNGVATNVGINTKTPSNTLEINSNDANATIGNSGLRFTDLINSSSATYSNPSGKVLTVDGSGNVVLADDEIGVGSGFTICSGGTPLNYLLKYDGTASACSSAVFEAPTTNYVGIGTSSPSAKLHSYISSSNTNLNAGHFELNNTNTGGSTSIGVSSYITSSGNSSANIWSMHGRATAVSGQSIVAGYFLSDGSGSSHYGVSGNANGASGTNYGVNGGASNSGATNNYGVYGRASNASNVNYGIYGAAPQSGSISSTNCAAYFVGDIYGTTGNFSTSDAMFKQNIQPLTNATNIIEQLNSKTYNFNVAGYPSMNLPLGTQYGLIAQEVEQVLPGMVKSLKNPETEINGSVIPEIEFKALSYETLIPILVAAFQEQKHELDSLKTIVANINGAPRSGTSGSEPQQRITLSNTKGIILHQNDPNPFTESTIVRYEIPEGVYNARILFSDMKGDIIKSASIEHRGQGTLEVFASDLSSGLYTYTLVCDGKVIDSKKMVKQ